MSLPVLARTWQLCVNNIAAANASTLTQSRNLVLPLVRAMLGLASGDNGWTDRDGGALSLGSVQGAWTCISCSDASTVSASPWDAASDLTWANAGSPHSWILLRNAASTLYVLIDLRWSGDTSINITVSHTAFTGGTISTAPTSTAGNLLPFNPSVSVGLASGNIATAWHLWLSADGQSTRARFCRAGVLVGEWNFDRAGDPQPTWASPYWTLCEGTDTDTDWWTYASYNENTDPTIGGSAVRSRGTTGIQLFLSPEGLTGTSNPMLARLVTTANAFSGRWGLWGAAVCSLTASNVGRHGHLVDMYYGPEAHNTGQGYDDDAAAVARFALFGAHALPWNGTPRVVNPGGAAVSTIAKAEFAATSPTAAPTPPTIENIDPLTGLNKRGSVSLDIVDDSGEFAAIVIGVSFDGGPIPDEVVYVLSDGVSGFATRYGTSEVEDISATRKRLTIRRRGVWPASPTFLPIAVDSEGSVNA